MHESDGTFDHVVHVDEFKNRFELPYHTKYKKIKRRKYALEATVIEDGDEEGGDDAKDRKDKEHDSAMALIAWIRIDPDFDWLSSVELRQRDFVWADMLLRDRDVVAQYEAWHPIQYPFMFV